MDSTIENIVKHIGSATSVVDVYNKWVESLDALVFIRNNVVNQVLSASVPPENRAAIIDTLVIGESSVIKAVLEKLNMLNSDDAATFKRTIQRDNQYLIEDLGKIYHSTAADATTKAKAYSLYITLGNGKAPPKPKDAEPELPLPMSVDDATPAPEGDAPSPLRSPTPPLQMVVVQPILPSAPEIKDFNDIDNASINSLEDFLTGKGYTNKQLNATRAATKNNDNEYAKRLRQKAKELYDQQDVSTSQPKQLLTGPTDAEINIIAEGTIDF